jgi:GST-like protein
MIRFYYHPTPNPAKIALFLGETGLLRQLSDNETSHRIAR